MTVKTRVVAGFACLAALCIAAASQAATFQSLYAFTASDGSPGYDTGLTIDKRGNLYGVHTGGGKKAPNGGIFKFDPTTDKLSWVYIFTGGGDGADPAQTLILDSAGNLYGTTNLGGSTNCQPGGCGTVFELNPDTKTLTTLHVFQNLSVDGGFPNTGSLAFDANGLLYGGTEISSGIPGKLFQLNPTNQSFNTISSIEEGPVGGLVVGNDGSIYGTTLNDVIFAVRPPSMGQTTWTLDTLYQFSGKDGNNPYSGLTADKRGVVGTAEYGFQSQPGHGTLFRFDLEKNSFSVLHRFNGGTDGSNPLVPVTVDDAGNIYGTALPGTGSSTFGTVYEYNLTTHLFTTLYAFKNKSDGAYPEQSVVIDNSGVLYGLAQGGKHSMGVIFKITP